MDDRRFDDLTRLFGSGHSRRALLRGIVGLAGGVFAGSAVRTAADARSLRTRPTIPSPSEPSCPQPNQLCGADCCSPGQCFSGHCCPESGDIWCGNQCWPAGLCTSAGTQCTTQQRVCGATCCPQSNDCARSGNQDICCDPATSTPCGLECCETELQCCDGECCAGTDICLARVFSDGPFDGEETCCPESQACDNQCCDGFCFSPTGENASGFDRTCCPADAAFCEGTGSFAGTGLCCAGETPDCCHEFDGSPVCLTIEQCCESGECAAPDACTPAECSNSVCSQQSVCPDTTPDCCGESVQDCVDLQTDDLNCGACGVPCTGGFVCVAGECVCDDDANCAAFDACTPGECIGGACRETSVCSGDDICCGTGAEAACCSSAECIAGACCTGQGETICTNTSGEPSCAPAGMPCCTTTNECSALDGCGGPDNLLHQTFVCGDGGFCDVQTADNCNSDNVCYDDFCDDAEGCSRTPVTCAGSTDPCLSPVCTPPSFGCGFSAESDGTEVTGGICCNSGDFILGGTCCDGAFCPFIDNCTSDICENNQCATQSACPSPPNPDCQTAVCGVDNTCDIVTDCGDYASVGQGSECDFGCQCPSNTVCSADYFQDPHRCRAGGGGGSNRPFCPTPP